MTLHLGRKVLNKRLRAVPLPDDLEDITSIDQRIDLTAGDRVRVVKRPSFSLFDGGNEFIPKS